MYKHNNFKSFFLCFTENHRQNLQKRKDKNAEKGRFSSFISDSSRSSNSDDVSDDDECFGRREYGQAQDIWGVGLCIWGIFMLIKYLVICKNYFSPICLILVNPVGFS